jgi:hypothetical protein
MMYLINNGGIRFEFDNPALGTTWRFQAATGNQDNFEITKVGTGLIEFRVDADGNAYVANDLEVGGTIVTNLNMPSDVALKQNFAAVEPEVVLEKVAALSVSAWEYKDKPGERHIGPMAQDFRAAFGLGDRDTSISVVDATGVALASIQALNAKLEARNAELEQRLAQLETVVKQLLPTVTHN